MIRIQQQRNYKFVNNLRQWKPAIDVGAYNLLIVGPLTIKLGTLIYHDKC